MPPAELADRAEVGRIARHDHHEVRPLHRRPGDPPRRVEAARIAVQKQRRHHPRVKRRLPQPAPVAAAHRGKVKLLSNQRHDQPRKMLLGHVVLHARRQKLRFIDLPGTKVLAHGYATNQTRPNLTSDFSDRLLGLEWTQWIMLSLSRFVPRSLNTPGKWLFAVSRNLNRVWRRARRRNHPARPTFRGSQMILRPLGTRLASP